MRASIIFHFEIVDNDGTHTTDVEFGFPSELPNDQETRAKIVQVYAEAWISGLAELFQVPHDVLMADMAAQNERVEEELAAEKAVAEKLDKRDIVLH